MFPHCYFCKRVNRRWRHFGTPGHKRGGWEGTAEGGTADRDESVCRGRAIHYLIRRSAEAQCHISTDVQESTVQLPAFDSYDSYSSLMCSKAAHLVGMLHGIAKTWRNRWCLSVSPAVERIILPTVAHLSILFRLLQRPGVLQMSLRSCCSSSE